MDSTRKRIIEACKSDNPEQKVMDIYKSEYRQTEDDDDEYKYFNLLIILSSLVDDVLKNVKMSRIFSEMRHYMVIDSSLSLDESLCATIIALIRQAGKEDFINESDWNEIRDNYNSATGNFNVK
jgi:hypothetical protein